MTNHRDDEKPNNASRAPLHLPPSSFLEPEARTALINALGRERTLSTQRYARTRDPADIPALRRYLDEKVFPPFLAAMSDRYPCTHETASIGGVEVEIVHPTGQRSDGILLNFHGGAFYMGARLAGLVESIPVAALTGITVISVNYRMAPEHKYPAATTDALTVYAELLKTHSAERVAMFGCSAGATLVAQVIAELDTRHLPTPAALGLFYAGGSFWDEGDTGHIGAAIAQRPIRTSRDNPYLCEADPDDPRAFPSRSDQFLSKFPPTLFVSGTRDHCLSSVAFMHSRLRQLGRMADLLVWEGLGHAFFYDPAYPQTHAAYKLISEFFAKRLDG